MRFAAGLDYDSLLRIYADRLQDTTIQIPSALDQWWIENSRNSEEKKLAKLVREFHEKSLDKFREEIGVLENVISELEAKQQKKPTKTAEKSLGAKLRKRETLQGKIAAIKEGKTSGRIFPMQFAPLIIESDGERRIILARYQVDDNFESFNARRDSLQKKATWKPLFGKSHGLFVFTKFYEWVERGNEKVMISFSPRGYEVMWAPAMYKHHSAGLDTFAMITDEPPPEVLAAGHDRCPVFLNEESVGNWLNPQGMKAIEVDALLDQKVKTFFEYQAA